MEATMTAQEEAADLLVHYFKMMELRNGRELNSDCQNEIRSIVSLIITAAVTEAVQEFYKNG
jgi:hypothetical protein